MHAVTLCLILLALTCCASIVARVVRLPLPFVQIAVGVVAAMLPFGLDAPLDPHTFLLLFIPPLLFGDGWNVPRRELLALRWPVFGLAVGLVLITVVVGGFALHWLLPAMPLAVAFAVAAVVSPTDAVAVSAITERIRVPHRMMHLLESEALLNDASGLVAMRFALAAALSGSFSLAVASGTFLLVALGGLATGWLLTLIYVRVHRWLLVSQRDAIVQTVLVGLLPFAAFGIAEELGVSGILAAVAAGMTASRVSLLEGAHFSARIQTGTTWSVASFCLNGSIFVLLGLQLPGIVGSGPAGIDLLTSNARLYVLGDIAALTALLITLRFAWVLVSALLGRAVHSHNPPNGWRVIVASSLAGVRGVVTLAGVLSFPLTLSGGAPFPARDLAVTLSTGVILCSMVIAAVGLPLLLRPLAASDHGAEKELRLARIAAAKAGMQAVAARQASPGSCETALITIYREHLTELQNGASSVGEDDDRLRREIHQAALHAERTAVQDLRWRGEIADPVARQLLGELDMIEAAAIHRPFRAPITAS